MRIIFEEAEGKLFYEIVLSDDDISRILERQGAFKEVVQERPNAEFVNFYIRRGGQDYAFKKRKVKESD